MGGRVETLMTGAAFREDDLTLTWSPGSEISSGIYYWCLRAGEQAIRKHMVILK
jgi:hypothetical protein